MHPTASLLVLLVAALATPTASRGGIEVWSPHSPYENPCLTYTCAPGFACFNTGPRRRECFNVTTGQTSMVEIVDRLAGYVAPGAPVDGKGAAATFFFPGGICAVTGSSNSALVTEESNLVRRVVSDGTVTTFAGFADGTNATVDGTGTNARFDNPGGIVARGDGTYYLVERAAVRALSGVGTVTTLAGTGVPGFANGPGATAQFNFHSRVSPHKFGNGNLIVHPNNTGLIVADTLNHRIRFVAFDGGYTSTLAGTGGVFGVEGVWSGTRTVSTAQISFPQALAFADGRLIVGSADRNNIVSIDFTTGVVTQLLGSLIPGLLDGSGLATLFVSPRAFAVVPGSNTSLVLSDFHVIRNIDIASTPSVTTIIGESFSSPTTIPNHCDFVPGKPGDHRAAKLCSIWGLAFVGSELWFVDRDRGGVGRRYMVPE